ncbi:MAG: CoA ester lyase [Burkholderiales bacterium]|nr:CoA ester lyase [Burkholderiales bacterium]
MRIWRSLLFVPANQRRMLDKISSLPADGFIFDLEDTIPAAEKANARAMAAEYIAQTPGNRSWVRVNAMPSGFLHEDLAEFTGMPGVAGLVVPKQDTPGDVAALDRMLTSVEVRKGLAPGSTAVIVMIESASGVLNSQQIIAGAKRIESAMYAGGEDGDMNVSLGATWTSEGPEMMFVRQYTMVAARAADIACPLDGVYSNIRDLDGFKRDTVLSKRLGYRGRAVIHPSQVEAANEIYTPSAAEIDYSARVIKAYDEAVARGTGSTTVDGKLVDIAMAKTAQRVLDLVKSIAR